MTNQMTIAGYFDNENVKSIPVYLWGKLDKAAHKFVARATFVIDGKKIPLTRTFKDGKHERMLDACAEIKAAQAAIRHARKEKMESITLRYHAPCVGGWGDGTWKTGSEYSRKFHDEVKAAREAGMTVNFEKIDRLAK